MMWRYGFLQKVLGKKMDKTTAETAKELKNTAGEVDKNLGESAEKIEG